jgi:superfamily II DNA or RNA helicase
MPVSPPLTLRPEQEAALTAIAEAVAHGITKPVVSMATGTGKTVMFAELLRRRGGSALVLAHREELIQQAAATIRRVWPAATVGIVRAREDDWQAPVVVASIASLQTRRLRRWAPDHFDTIVVDEAHHAISSSFRQVLAYLAPSVLLGVTATPFRSDRASLAQIFDRVVYAFGIEDAIAAGTLVDLVAYQVRTHTDLDAVRVEAGDFLAGDLDRVLNTEERNAGIVAGYQAYTPGRRAVAFCAGVRQAEALALSFTEHGVPAAAVHGGLAAAERQRRLAALGAGTVPVVTSVGVLTEGWDEPRLESLLLARPTKSLALYTQMVGRVLRAAPGKLHGTLLDFVDATERHRLVTVRDLFGLQRLPPSGTSVIGAVTAEQADREAFATLATRILPSVDRTAVTDLFARFADTAIPPEIDWRDVLDDVPARPTRRTPASPAQVKALIAFGWPFDEAVALSAGQAHAALGTTLATQREWAALRAPLWADLTRMPAHVLREAYYSRPWHFQRPTPKQRAWCAHHGLHLPAGCTAGEVSLLIDQHQQGAPRTTSYRAPPTKGATDVPSS